MDYVPCRQHVDTHNTSERTVLTRIVCVLSPSSSTSLEQDRLERTHSVRSGRIECMHSAIPDLQWRLGIADDVLVGVDTVRVGVAQETDLFFGFRPATAYDMTAHECSLMSWAADSLSFNLMRRHRA